MGVGSPRIGLTPGPGRVPGEAFSGPIEIRYIQYPDEEIFPGRGLYMDWENRYITYPGTTSAVYPGSDLFIRSEGAGSERDGVFLLKGNSTQSLVGARSLVRTLTSVGAGRSLLVGLLTGPTYADRKFESVRVHLGGVRVRGHLATGRVRANLARVKERVEIQ